jgi:hypothetical protein
MRQSTRTWLALTSGMLVICGCAWIIATIYSAPSQHPDRGEVASEWQGYLAPVAIALTLLAAIVTFWRKGLRPRADPLNLGEVLDRASERLAQQTLNRWIATAHHSGLTDVAPIEVQWAWRRANSLPPEELFTAHPAPEQGSVMDLHDRLWSFLTHRRLVILGEPGRGKSGALTLILLKALECRQANASTNGRAPRPVPVVVGLSRWRPGEEPLLKYIASAMVRDYPALIGFGRDTSEQLLQGDRVFLLLDGLDELPPDLQREALRRIDADTAGIGFILLLGRSRTSEPPKARVWHTRP